MTRPTSQELIKSLDNPCTSYWLHYALESALKRDPHDAALDADILRTILVLHLEEVEASSNEICQHAFICDGGYGIKRCCRCDAIIDQGGAL